MFSVMLMVGFGEISSKVHAPAFPALLGRLGHEQRHCEHVLTFPALGRIEDLVHHVPLPEPDDLLCFGERLSRDAYERLIASLARAGWVQVRDDAFERDGRVIAFRRVSLTAAGRRADDLGRIPVPIDLDETAPRRRRTRGVRSLPRIESPKSEGSDRAEPPAELVEALRDWRLRELVQKRSTSVASELRLGCPRTRRPRASQRDG